MLWIGGDPKHHPVLIPCHGKGHVPLSQVAPNPSNPPGTKPVPRPCLYHSEKFVPYLQSKPIPFQLEVIPPCPITPYPCKKSLLRFQLHDKKKINLYLH